MNSKILLFLSMGAAFVCALLMLFVAYQGNEARSSVSQYGIGVFNYTSQNTHNISQFMTTLREYQTEEEPLKKTTFKREYLKHFDVLWSAFVTLQQFQNDLTSPGIAEYVESAKRFAQELDKLMKPDRVLTDNEIREIIQKAADIRQQTINLSNVHYQYQSTLRDDTVSRIKILNTAYGVLGAVLFVAVGSFLLLLWSARKRELQSTAELRTAHEQLIKVVEELRSGNLERKAKNRFIAAASHDLRQPLHALGLYLSSLEKSVHEPEGLRLLNKIRQSTAALNGLFNSLLDISKLDAGVVEISQEHFELRSFLTEIQQDLAQAALEAEVDMQFSKTEQVVYTDRLLFLRIVRNLAENSLSHAPGSVLSIVTRGAPGLNDKRIVLEISDDGPGIPEAEHAEVFSEYYQLNNPERDRNKGLGLGLSIVKRLTDLLKLEMSFESNLGKGTTFRIYLPAGDAALIKSETGMYGKHFQEPASLGKLLVLVIDDEKDIRDGMSVMFNNDNCDVIASESAEAARLELVERDVSPDIIIADYRLRDGLTGRDAVNLIREEFNIDIPALIVTGDTSAERVKEASESGMRLLHKPVVPEELLAIMKVILDENKKDTS